MYKRNNCKAACTQSGNKAKVMTKTRTPKMVAKILMLLYAKKFHDGEKNVCKDSMYLIFYSELLSLSGYRKMTDELINDIDEHLRNYGYALYNFDECCFVTSIIEIESKRWIPNVLMNKYKHRCQDTNIHKEFEELLRGKHADKRIYVDKKRCVKDHTEKVIVRYEGGVYK